MITLDNDILTFEANGGVIDIYYMSDNPISKEAITSKPDWIETEIFKDGAQEGHISITVSKNDGFQREATLEFSAYDQIDVRNVSTTIEINQLESQVAVGSVTIKSIEVDGEKVAAVNVDEKKHTLKVILEKSMINDINVLSSSGWVNLYSQGENEYVFNITENTGAERNTSITFEAHDLLGNTINVYVTVTQEKHYEISIYFKVEDLYAKNNEAIYDLHVESENVAFYQILKYTSWVEIQNYDSNKITLKILQNPTYKDREGTITYSVHDSNEISHTYTSNIF